MNKRRGFFRLIFCFSILIFVGASIVSFFYFTNTAKIIQSKIEKGAYLKMEEFYKMLMDFHNLPKDEKERVINPTEAALILRKYKISLYKNDKLKAYETPKYYSVISKFYELSEKEQKKVLDIINEGMKAWFFDIKPIEPKRNISIAIESIIWGLIFIAPIWLIYGLIVFVIQGFISQSKN